jgi:hypothetical protein
MTERDVARLLLAERDVPMSFWQTLWRSLRRGGLLVTLLVLGLVVAVFMIAAKGPMPGAYLLIGVVIGRASGLVQAVRAYLAQAKFTFRFIDWQKVEHAAKDVTPHRSAPTE